MLGWPWRMRKMRRGRMNFLRRRRRMKKLTLSQMEMQSRKFMSCSSPIQSEKENSSNSRVIKANTGLGVQCQNKQCLGVLVSWCWFSQWQWWWTQPLLMRRIGQRKYNYSQWEILIYSIWLTGVMKRWQNCVAQEEIWFESQTNPIQHFPKFEEVSCGAGIEISH